MEVLLDSRQSIYTLITGIYTRNIQVNQISIQFTSIIQDRDSFIAQLLIALFSNYTGIYELQLINLPPLDTNGELDLFQVIATNKSIRRLLIRWRTGSSNEGDVLTEGLTLMCQKGGLLQHLDISYGNITSDSWLLERIPGYTCIEELNLSSSNLDGSNIADLVIGLTNLRFLNISNCNLGLNPLATLRILFNQNLRWLNLSNNNLSNQKAYFDIFEFIACNLSQIIQEGVSQCALEYLDLSNNGLDSSEIISVLHGILQNQTIISLDLRNNGYDFNSGIDNAILEIFEVNTSITNIWIDPGRITQNTSQMIMESILLHSESNELERLTRNLHIS
jgi:uncharacterized protein YjbI with pentapeptide repeats